MQNKTVTLPLPQTVLSEIGQALHTIVEQHVQAVNYTKQDDTVLRAQAIALLPAIRARHIFISEDIIAAPGFENALCEQYISASHGIVVMHRVLENMDQEGPPICEIPQLTRNERKVYRTILWLYDGQAAVAVYPLDIFANSSLRYPEVIEALQGLKAKAVIDMDRTELITHTAYQSYEISVFYCIFLPELRSRATQARLAGEKGCLLQLIQFSEHILKDETGDDDQLFNSLGSDICAFEESHPRVAQRMQIILQAWLDEHKFEVDISR